MEPTDGNKHSSLIDDAWAAELHGDDVPEAVDTIIVGAGAAGCVLAGRLSEDRDRQVLLLEAGSALPTKRSATPGLAYYALGPDVLYENATVPQTGLRGRTMAVPSGKGLGGGSSVNLLAWFQGHPEDYDAWRSSGAVGWGWDDVWPVFRRLEHHTAGANEFHGVGGPMVIDTPRDVEPSQMAFVAAAEQVGMPVTEDFNGAQRTGAGLSSVNIRDGVRHSVVDGYLAPARRRANLSVRVGMRVDRVLLDGGRATGVQLADGRTVRARQQVVLAAGALRTPQLLMLSGIGPGDQLSRHGIEPLVDSPEVGAGLQDHPMVPAVWSVTSGRTLLDAQDEPSMRAYRLLRRGPLSGLATSGAMFPLAGEGEAATIQALLYMIGLGPGMMPVQEPAASVTIALQTPHSRGTLTLDSADPAAAPRIDPGYLSDPRDLPRLRAGFRRVQEIMSAPAMREVCGEALFPAGDIGDEDLDRWLIDNVQTQWHPVGTCRMGEDPRAVVNSRLEVNGVEELMVADASVMPTITRGNTQAPTVMVAERAAEFISQR